MKEYKEIQVALLGLGTVGLGVYKVLQMQKEEMQHKIGTEIKIKKILVRNLEKAAGKIEDASVLTDSWQEIVNDDEIQDRDRSNGRHGAGKNVYHGSDAGRKTGRDGK